MLARMKSRALFLIGALLASSAWAQEPSFDLKSDAIRKIVHDSAASQSESKLILEPEDLRPLDQPIKTEPPRRTAKPKRQGPVSALIDTVVNTVVDDALGVDENGLPPGGYSKWVACQSVVDTRPSLPPIAACPGVAVPNGK